MTAPSDFLDLDRFDNEGGANHERIEEAWDEPGFLARCTDCGIGLGHDFPDAQCRECFARETLRILREKEA